MFFNAEFCYLLCVLKSLETNTHTHSCPSVCQSVHYSIQILLRLFGFNLRKCVCLKEIRDLYTQSCPSVCHSVHGSIRILFRGLSFYSWICFFFKVWRPTHTMPSISVSVLVTIFKTLLDDVGLCSWICVCFKKFRD